ncbi:MAG: uroporphyrinogen-III synthase [Sphingomonas sp.]
MLVLRPEPGASATVERARQHGLDAVAIPVFRVEPLGWRPPDPSGFDGLLLTSANAVRHAGDGLKALRALQVYAVGKATAQGAREAGFHIAATGDSGVDRLLRSLEPDLRLLHLCGDPRREPEAPPQSLTTVTVYRSHPIGDPDLSAADGNIVLVHSPRAGQRLGELVRDRGSITIAAISRAAADAVGSGWRTVESVEQPTDDALLALAASLCNNSSPK